jgi:hypothetical protein
LNARGITLLDIGTMVNAAHSIYCPGNACDAPTLCIKHRMSTNHPIVLAGFGLQLAAPSTTQQWAAQHLWLGQ